MPKKQTTEGAAPAAEINVATEAQLRAAMLAIFKSEDGFDVPDEALVGQFMDTMEQLQARVDHLTRELIAIHARLGMDKEKETK